MMNDEWHLFFNIPKPLNSYFLSFLPLQICVNPRLSAAKKSFPFFNFFVFPAFFVFLISNR
ncbi:hypothetical protein AUK22_11990 [bacterium CG2_30_54_10]|nr:MAG: hypothetical protein AUK22_11990 [bacterium CG2_30_54_10]